MPIFSPSGVSNITANNSDLLASSPSIVNETLATANTEVAIILPAGTKRYKVRARGSAKLQLSYTVAESGVTYWTILPGNIYEETGLDSSSSYTLYIQSNKASTVIELVLWS